MIHRALLGSLERFFGILIEHYSGWFPTWLAPVQCTILTINSDVLPYAQSVLASLKQLNIRADLDSSSEKIGYKIRQAITQKIPYLIIIGDKEKENNQITLRHKKDNLGSFSLESFIQSYQQEFYSPIDNDT